MLDAIGVRGPAWRRVQGGEAVAAAARELGYPDEDVALKPVFSSGSRGFRILSASADRREQLLTNRPGVAEALRLEDLLELLGDDETELLVMELATGKERTIDGFAEGGRIVLGHPKTREAMRAGLAMYFETLDDPELMEIAAKIVAELELDHFFNIQLVGDHVIEINPRISTIVYQEDLNLPYLGVKHALGELSDEELAEARRASARRGASSATSTKSSGMNGDRVQNLALAQNPRPRIETGRASFTWPDRPCLWGADDSPTLNGAWHR